MSYEIGPIALCQLITHLEFLSWDDIFTQAFRYVSDRTGVMAYANLSLLWLFGSRNNPFLWATGWSFATFNIFHRAIARVATIQAIIHSIGYTVLTLEGQRIYHIHGFSWKLFVDLVISSVP